MQTKPKSCTKLQSCTELQSCTILKSHASIHMQRFSPAKINLFLHIIGKRLDGYHNLQTVFRLLNWGDTLSFKVTDSQFDPYQPITDDNLSIRLNTNVKLTNSPLDNLIVKASIKLIEAVSNDSLINSCSVEEQSIGNLPKALPVIQIDLDKVIPTGAGLGGGSSNAATTLLALNELWGFNFKTKDLITIGASVGADVPIFIVGRDSIGEGIGEILTPIELPPCHYLLLTPDAHINTATLFTHPDLRRDIEDLSLTQIRDNKDKYIYEQLEPFYNVFEPVVTTLSAPVNEALAFMQDLEPITHSTARMTGSGSCVLLPYHAKHEAQLQARCKDAPCPAYFVSTL